MKINEQIKERVLLFKISLIIYIDLFLATTYVYKSHEDSIFIRFINKFPRQSVFRNERFNISVCNRFTYRNSSFLEFGFF